VCRRKGQIGEELTMGKILRGLKKLKKNTTLM
jgi:hypothetical protein